MHGQESVELNYLGIGSLEEVNLHSKDAGSNLSHVRGTDHSTVLHDRVGTYGSGLRGNNTLGHIITVDLHSVDVSNNSEAVVDLNLDSSKVGNTSKGVPEVLGTHSRLSRSSSDHIGPSLIIERSTIPSGGGTGGILPSRTLVDRSIQGELNSLLSILNHHSLEDDVVVNALNTDPSSITPRVGKGVQHLKSVLVVGSSVQAQLNITDGVVLQGGGCVKFSGSRENLERLMSSIGLGDLGDLSVDLIRTTGDALSRNDSNYA